MAKLLLKVLLLGGVLLLLNLALAPLLPYPWGHPQLEAKIEHWRQHRGEIDTFFLGSSWTYRQISPQAFDQALGDGTRSFNFGADGVFYPQIPHVFAQLDAEGAKPKRWIVELSRIVSAVDPELGSTREEKYWLSPAATNAMVRALLERPDKSWSQKLLQSSRLSLQLVERAYHVGLGADALEFLRAGQADVRFLGPNGDGFYPVEAQVEEEKGEAFDNAFLRDPASSQKLAQLAEESRQAFAIERYPEPSREQLRELRGLIQKAEERDSELIFVVPPRLGRRYDLILPVAKALPPELVLLDIADPSLHPELYGLELTIDRTHMNRRGAELYSQELAKVLRRREQEGEGGHP